MEIVKLPIPQDVPVDFPITSKSSKVTPRQNIVIKGWVIFVHSLLFIILTFEFSNVIAWKWNTPKELPTLEALMFLMPHKYYEKIALAKY